MPAFPITLAADYCTTCSDAEFCTLVEHELYHIGHTPDPYGAPAFDKEGRPKLRIVGHDVEEFVGVVARYVASSDVLRLAGAAGAAPSVQRPACSGQMSRGPASPVYSVRSCSRIDERTASLRN